MPEEKRPQSPHPMDAPVEPYTTDEVSGWMLVAAQVFALLAIVLIGVDSYPWSVVSWILLGLGALIGLPGVVSIGKSFRVHPTPNNKGLQTKGIYSLIRNPMYLGLILASLGVALDSRKPMAWLFFGFLALVLLAKIFTEEKELQKAYPDYAEYKRSTKRLIPFLW